jgi:hypothetical protein
MKIVGNKKLAKESDTKVSCLVEQLYIISMRVITANPLTQTSNLSAEFTLIQTKCNNLRVVSTPPITKSSSPERSEISGVAPYYLEF